MPPRLQTPHNRHDSLAMSFRVCPTDLQLWPCPPPPQRLPVPALHAIDRLVLAGCSSPIRANSPSGRSLAFCAANARAIACNDFSRQLLGQDLGGVRNLYPVWVPQMGGSHLLLASCKAAPQGLKKAEEDCRVDTITQRPRTNSPAQTQPFWKKAVILVGSACELEVMQPMCSLP